MDSGNDLFVYKAPDVPTSRVYTIRPYLPTDESQVYDVCNKTCKDGLGDSQQYPEELKNVHSDRIVGPYLTLHPELSMVVEDETGIVGYACAALDYQKFRVKQELAWVPEMCLKYPIGEGLKDLPKLAQVTINKTGMGAVEMSYFARWFFVCVFQESISHFHNFKDESHVSSTTHPSSLISSLLPSVLDQSVSKRLITCLLAAIRANGKF